jgi:hypothetical protein
MTYRQIHLLIVLALLASGCNLPFAPAGDSGSPDAVMAWFDAPLPNSIFYPPNPCQWVAHAASPAGIALFELTINDEPAVSIPSPEAQSSLVTLSQDCGLSEPGAYLLRLRARDNRGEWSAYAETSLVIAGDEPPEAATETPTPEPAQEAGIRFLSRSTDTVFYNGASCGPKQVTLVVEATHPEPIKVVVLFFRVKYKTSNEATEFSQAAMTPTGNDLYQVSIMPETIFNPGPPMGTPMGMVFIPPADAWLQVQAVIQTDGGDTTTRTPLLSEITVKYCSH